MVSPRPGRGNGLSVTTNVNGLRPFRVREPGLSATDRSVNRFKPNRIQRMSSFDPASVLQAVAEFTPCRPQRFQELAPARDVIAELRKKRASYRAIAELLTQHCLPISKTAVAAFCHEVLGEVVRPRRRPGRKRIASTSCPLVETAVTAEELKASKVGLVTFLFLSGKEKEENAKELKTAFKLTDDQAGKIVRRITGRARFFRRAFDLMAAK